MLEILENIILILKSDATITSIVPSTNILTGPVDIATEKQAGLFLPQINIHTVSEVSRTVPLNTRDTIIQIDIWSRNSILETIQVYERVIVLLNYISPTNGTSKVFWERLGGAIDQYESDRRIFHRSMSLQVWSIKP